MGMSFIQSIYMGIVGWLRRLTKKKEPQIDLLDDDMNLDLEEVDEEVWSVSGAGGLSTSREKERR